MNTLFDALLKARTNAITARVGQVGQINEARKTAGRWISSFIQCFNEACDRKEPGFKIQDRAAYNLEISNRQTPKINSDTMLMIWGPNIIGGEAIRVSSGGTPMPFPSIADLTAKYTA